MPVRLQRLSSCGINDHPETDRAKVRGIRGRSRAAILLSKDYLNTTRKGVTKDVAKEDPKNTNIIDSSARVADSWEQI